MGNEFKRAQENSAQIELFPAADAESLAAVANKSLTDVNTALNKASVFTVPIGKLMSLGAGVSSLLPAFRTVSQTMELPGDGLYRIANAAVGDTLKVAKNGNFWGALKTTAGKSKFVQLQEAGPLSATNTVVSAINPATVMMAAALFSIEQQLGEIAKLEKQIISFLEAESESQVEADILTLRSMVDKYKQNWDNEHYIASNHKSALDIQRTARKNIIAYKKRVSEELNSRRTLISKGKTTAVMEDLVKKFKYYRLSLITFSMASMVEVMLSGNFKEKNIEEVKGEIEQLSIEYRELFSEVSSHLEKMSQHTVETLLLKGTGSAGTAMGNLIGSIPVLKEGPVDEWLVDGGSRLKKDAGSIEKELVASFALVKDPGTAVFIDRLKDFIQIYGRTTEIAFDQDNLYLIAG